MTVGCSGFRVADTESTVQGYTAENRGGRVRAFI